MSNERHMTEQQFQSIAASTLLRLINDQADTIAEQEDRIEELEALLKRARWCISKHQGGCVNGCWEATAAPDARTSPDSVVYAKTTWSPPSEVKMMSSELVKRLRRDVEPKDMTPWSTLMHEAADRIEELEAALYEAHEAVIWMSGIADIDPATAPHWVTIRDELIPRWVALGGDPDARE